MKTPKQTLRSIKDVYSRLKWDGSIDSASITIGYQDRMRGLVEMPFSDFRPGGRVPWDRIQYFRLDELRIWDRLTRIDLIFGSGDTPAKAKLITAATDAGATETSGFGAGWPRLRARRWSPGSQAWTTDFEVTEQVAGKWKILTLNILSNSLIPDRPQDDARYRALLEFLKTQDADLVALQEIDGQFMQLLEADPWTRSQYHMADNDGMGASRSHFEAILSKAAPRTVAIPLVAEQSRCVLTQFQHKGQKLTVVGLHLVSDWREGAAEKREAFLQALTAQLPQDEALILLGDFNFGDEHVAACLQDYTDLWRELYPGQAGITYAGSENALAQAIYPNARTRRLDRMFMKHDARFPLMESMEVIAAVDPLSKMPLSDHYALAGTLSFVGSFGALRSAPKDNHSALCIIPPANLWAEIQALRRQYDASFSRWMPHINLVYGFVPAAYFPEAQAALQAALADEPAFDLRLEGFDSFEHKDSTSIYLKPDAESIATLRQVQSIANALFPQCNDVQRHGVFNPHLTVAKIPHSRKKDARRFLQEWNAIWEPITFRVEALSLIARSEISAFEVLAQATLADASTAQAPDNIQNSLAMLGLVPGKIAAEGRKAGIAQVQRGIQSMGADLRLFPVGSTALGTMQAESDLDFVCVGRMPAAAFMALAPKRMEGMQFARQANNALVPALKFYFPGFSADVSYVELSAEFPLESPADWSEALRAKLSPAQARALRAITDSKLLLDLAGQEAEAYRIATRALKVWAEAQRIKGNAFGYPGGFAWSLMLAQVGPYKNPESWLKAFLEDFLHRDRTGITAEGDLAAMLLLTGEQPAFNITRNVSRQTLAIMKNAAEEALLHIWAIADGDATWRDFFAPREEAFVGQIELRWHAHLRQELEVCSGWLQSQIFGLIQRLESIEGLRIRPDAAFYAPEKLTQAYRIGLNTYPTAAQAAQIDDLLSALEEAFICQPQQPSGASIRTMRNTEGSCLWTVAER